MTAWEERCIIIVEIGRRLVEAYWASWEMKALPTPPAPGRRVSIQVRYCGGSKFKGKGDSYTDDCDVNFGHGGQFAVFNCSVGLGCSGTWGNCGAD